MSDEKGTFVTICCATNALENTINLILIIPMVPFRPEFLRGAPPSYISSSYH